jgi:hydrogenase-4 component E
VPSRQGVILGILTLIHPFSGHLPQLPSYSRQGNSNPHISNAVRKAQIRREVEPFIGYVPL